MSWNAMKAEKYLDGVYVDKYGNIRTFVDGHEIIVKSVEIKLHTKHIEPEMKLGNDIIKIEIEPDDKN